MEQINQIRLLDDAAMERAREKWNGVAKPLHSLGLLEESIIKIAGITGKEQVKLDRRCAIIMCGDNGIVEEGVTQTDSSVTKSVAESMVQGKANINRMAQVFQADVRVVDIGMTTESNVEGIITAKCVRGTRNFVKEPALTKEEVKKCIEVGIEQVRQCKELGYQIIVTGEMGIGNTTTSSAIAAVLLGEEVEKVTGRGAGLNEQGLRKKIQIIKEAIKRYEPNEEDAIDLLSKLGGTDIAGMVGVFLGGGIYQIPIVIDGLISSVAAALAIKINKRVRDYMLGSHVSKEPAGQMMLDFIQIKPLIKGELCLGEGTGAILLLPLLDGALAIYEGSHHFSDLNLPAYKEQESCLR